MIRPGGSRSRSTSVLRALALIRGGAGAARAGGIDSASDRTDDPVAVTGAELAPLAGRPIADFGLFRYDPSTGQFDPIPFQVDERFTKTFDPGEPTQFSEMVYDVFGEDDGLFDTDDELVFLFGDAGPQAPIGEAWVSGADPLRFEVAVDDPRSVGAAPRQWVYLFTGAGLPTSPVSYVTWDGLPTTSITTDVFQLDYDGNWLMTGLSVFPPCGTGSDLIDRWKGRAEPLVELIQDEEDWNGASTWLGGLAGPVRAIRYVRGARSGVNTVYHDIVGRKGWTRHMNMRVHVLASVWFYFDWLPEAGSLLYTPSKPTGITVDGVPDAGISTAYTDWHLMRTPSGGAFVAYDVPQTALFSGREFFYVDDSSHDDMVAGKITYSDDDDSAYGAHGFKLLDPADSNLTPIQVRFRLIPLCGGEGDSNLAGSLLENVTTPLDPNPLPQSNCGAIRTLLTDQDGADILLTWQALPEADAYRVYRSDIADLPRASWSLLSESPLLEYRDVGAVGAGTSFYSVVCVRQGGEGPW